MSSARVCYRKKQTFLFFSQKNEPQIYLDKLYVFVTKIVYIKMHLIHKNYLYRHVYKYTDIYLYVNVLKYKYII